jgi:phosphopantetheine--protein transferase-like protein
MLLLQKVIYNQYPIIVGIGIDIIDLKKFTYESLCEVKLKIFMEEVFCSEKDSNLETLARDIAINEAVFKSLEDRWQSSFRGVRVIHEASGRPRLFIDLERCPYLLRYSIDVSVSHHGDILAAIAISSPIKLYKRIQKRLLSFFLIDSKSEADF